MARVGGYPAEFRRVFLKWIPSTCGCAATGAGLVYLLYSTNFPPYKTKQQIVEHHLGSFYPIHHPTYTYVSVF